jgi:hypothetical protein
VLAQSAPRNERTPARTIGKAREDRIAQPVAGTIRQNDDLLGKARVERDDQFRGRNRRIGARAIRIGSRIRKTPIAIGGAALSPHASGQAAATAARPHANAGDIGRRRIFVPPITSELAIARSEHGLGKHRRSRDDKRFEAHLSLLELVHPLHATGRAGNAAG